MSWIRLLDLEDLPDSARPAAQSGQAQYGQLLNTWRVLFHRPDTFAAYLPFLRAVAGPGAVDPLVKDLCAVLVGALNNCRYTVSHRCASARRNGADDAVILQVVGEDWSGLTDELRAALELTRSMTLDPALVPYPDRPGLVPDPVKAKAAQHFAEDELVELALSAAVWNALSRFHRVMELDLDMDAPPAGADPAHPAPRSRRTREGLAP